MQLQYIHPRLLRTLRKKSRRSSLRLCLCYFCAQNYFDFSKCLLARAIAAWNPLLFASDRKEDVRSPMVQRMANERAPDVLPAPPVAIPSYSAALRQSVAEVKDPEPEGAVQQAPSYQQVMQ